MGAGAAGWPAARPAACSSSAHRGGAPGRNRETPSCGSLSSGRSGSLSAPRLSPSPAAASRLAPSFSCPVYGGGGPQGRRGRTLMPLPPRRALLARHLPRRRGRKTKRVRHWYCEKNRRRLFSEFWEGAPPPPAAEAAKPAALGRLQGARREELPGPRQPASRSRPWHGRVAGMGRSRPSRRADRRPPAPGPDTSAIRPVAPPVACPARAKIVLDP